MSDGDFPHPRRGIKLSDDWWEPVIGKTNYMIVFINYADGPAIMCANARKRRSFSVFTALTHMK
jgi:hypothetical protein